MAFSIVSVVPTGCVCAASDETDSMNVDPEQPEPELTRTERAAERHRLRDVRRERRRQSVKRAKGNKKEAKGKGEKKRR